MSLATVEITNKNKTYIIFVDGRATFECCPALRTLAKTLEQSSFSGIAVDLEKCTGMDSTFMGILAMLALRAKKQNTTLEIYNANDENIALLHGLGLQKLFIEKTGNIATGDAEKLNNDENEKIDVIKAVVDAHETLMDVDDENVKKFEKVVDFAKKDLNDLESK